MVQDTWRHQLNEEEQGIVAESLRAAVDGPFFPDREFHILFGLDREAVRAVFDEWPETSDADTQFLAVNGAMNNLLGYPHRKDDQWSQYLSVSREELDALFDRIRELSGAADATRRYLTRLLAEYAVLPEDELRRRPAWVQTMINAATRYDVPVPDRLRSAAGGAS